MAKDQIRKSLTGEGIKKLVADRGRSRVAGTVKISSTPSPAKTEGEMDWAWIDSPENLEFLRKREERRQKAEERRAAKNAAFEAAREERRQNPKTPLDAYYNHMEKCPFPSGSKERRQWKNDNPVVFEGVTYRDHWSPQLSNSGKTSRWFGYLVGSDGSTIEIMNEHINNRRNDPDRNWGLGPE